MATHISHAEGCTHVTFGDGSHEDATCPVVSLSYHLVHDRVLASAQHMHARVNCMTPKRALVTRAALAALRNLLSV